MTSENSDACAFGFASVSVLDLVFEELNRLPRHASSSDSVDGCRWSTLLDVPKDTMATVKCPLPFRSENILQYLALWSKLDVVVSVLFVVCVEN